MSADPKATHVVAEWTYTSPLISVRFDPQGRYLFSTAEDSAVQRWDLKADKPLVLKGHETWVRGIAFAGDGEALVTGGYDDTLIWWPVEGENVEPIRKVRAHDGWIRALETHPDGQLLASGGNDRVVRLWNAADGALVRELEGHEKHVYSIFFHPEGEFVLTGDLAGVVRQWEVATGKYVRSFEAKALHTYNGGQKVDYGGVRSMTLSPDGKHLACAGLHKATNPLGAVNEPLIMVFDWESQKLVRSLVAPGVRGIAWRVVHHPDNFLVAAAGGSGGGHLLFWKPDQDKPLHTLKMKNTAREMDLHQDQVRLATAHHDRRVRISSMTPKAK